jgi:hypothetical protein
MLAGLFKPFIASTATHNSATTTAKGETSNKTTEKEEAQSVKSSDFLDTGSLINRMSSNLQPIMEHPPCSLALAERQSLMKCQMFNRSEMAREALFDWVEESMEYNAVSPSEDEVFSSNNTVGPTPTTCRRRRSTAAELLPGTPPKSLAKNQRQSPSDIASLQQKFYRNLRKSQSLEMITAAFDRLDVEEQSSRDFCDSPLVDMEQLSSASSCSSMTDSGCPSEEEVAMAIMEATKTAISPFAMPLLRMQL